MVRAKAALVAASAATTTGRTPLLDTQVTVDLDSDAGDETLTRGQRLSLVQPGRDGHEIAWWRTCGRRLFRARVSLAAQGSGSAVEALHSTD